MITWTIQLSSGGHKTYNFLLWSKGLSIMPCAPFSFPLPWTGNPDIHHTTPDSSRACLSFSQPQEAGLTISREIAKQLHLFTSAAKMQSTMKPILLHQHLFSYAQFFSDSTVKACCSSEHPKWPGLLDVGVKEEHSAWPVNMLVPKR